MLLSPAFPHHLHPQLPDLWSKLAVGGSVGCGAALGSHPVIQARSLFRAFWAKVLREEVFKG